MAQQDKELLLIDLCARLTYGVKINVNGEEDTLLELGVDTGWANASYDIEDVKPYLRPMSSMTEEEKEELKEIGSEYLMKWENAQDPIDKWRLDAEVSYKRSEFYNSHLLDWRGLIPKGLALETPEGMYNLNK